MSCGSENAPFASASVIKKMNETVGGPKAMARPGDFVLENEFFKIAVLGARNSLGPGLSGGSLIDADIQRYSPDFAGGQGKDQFAELFPTTSMNITYTDPEDPDSVRVLADGKDGNAAIVRVQGPAVPFLSLLDALWALVGSPAAYMTTDYIVEPGVPWVTIQTTTTFNGEEENAEGDLPDYYTTDMALIELAIETGAVFGDFYLSGGSVDVFAPGIGFDEDGAVFEAQEAGGNTFVSPFQFDFVAGVSDGVSYGMAAAEGDTYVPLFTSSQTVTVVAAKEGDGSLARFDAGEAYTFERYFFIGHGDIASIIDQYVEAKNIDYGTVSGNALEDGTGLPLSDVDVFVYESGADRPWSQFRTDVAPGDGIADGSFSGRLPVGTWDLVVHEKGRPNAQRLKNVKIKKGKNVQVLVSAPRTGTVRLTIRDELGVEVPAKVTLFRKGGPLRDPVLGDGFIGGAPEAVVFVPYGQGEVQLAPGEYRAVASRGLEYEIDESDFFTVNEATGADIDLTVIRSLNTPGWISADLHVHSQPSHDSGVSFEQRVITMVAEGVEFFASTDHDHITDFAPVIEEMGLQHWVQSAVGNEVTTVEVGHFLAFPLAHDFQGDQGADTERMDWTGKEPDVLIEQMRSVGADAGLDPLIFIGHPRDGILGYFDQYGFDPYGGSPGRGGEPGQVVVYTPLLSVTNPLLASSNMEWDFDALELFNGKRFDYLRTPTQGEMDAYTSGTADITDFYTRTLEEQEGLKDGVYRLGYGIDGVIDDWFVLLNLGYKFTAMGNSDTHGTTGVESGCPRNYVMSDVDDPAFLDDQDVANAVKEHRVVASYGPFVEFWADGNGIGSEFQPGGDTIELKFEVQAPMWIDVSRVELYENGTLIEEWSVDSATDVLRISESLEVTPTVDSWYVLVAMGDGDLAPVFTPVEMPPIELQSVVTDALAGVEAVGTLLGAAVPIPQVFPVRPYAMTNPIWIDLDGDGFDAPGHPDWWLEPKAPE
ncbi:MAG: hypothetical protein GWP91_18565 [Rhodobacterales bacterium]|nr:hypothetical protein [Rhodobacterales bacterium]